MSGPCRRCVSVKQGVADMEAKLRQLFYQAETRVSLRKSIPAMQERLENARAHRDQHQHEDHGGDEPNRRPAELEDRTPDHGTIKRYMTYKCRCDECRRANSEKSKVFAKALKERPIDPDDERHGTVGFYAHHHCRCERCKAAASASYYAKKAAS